MELWAELLTLAVTAFVAATIFPAQSELLLLALQHQGNHHPLILLAVASFGNVLGALVNYALGRGLTRFQRKRWFPCSASALARATTIFERYGVWSLLFAWLPIIGDALTVAAGFLRTPLPLFMLLVALGKVARYAVLLGLWMVS
jgi:membrane protein YqaA with SNARE-associated domain